MNEADKIKMDRLEYQVKSLEKENEVLHRTIFKYKLKNGEIEPERPPDDVLQRIHARKMGNDIFAAVSEGFGALDD